jgi:hypothetical protein
MYNTVKLKYIPLVGNTNRPRCAWFDSEVCPAATHIKCMDNWLANKATMQLPSCMHVDEYINKLATAVVPAEASADANDDAVDNDSSMNTTDNEVEVEGEHSEDDMSVEEGEYDDSDNVVNASAISQPMRASMP